jgi:uncharacterized protein YhaN
MSGKDDKSLVEQARELARWIDKEANPTDTDVRLRAVVAGLADEVERLQRELNVTKAELRSERGAIRRAGVRVAALEAGIAEHRDEHHRLDREDNHITRDLGRGDADLALWALLDAGQTDG